MTLEQIVLVLVLVLIPLFRLISPVLKRRLEELTRQAGESAAAPLPSAAPIPSTPRVESRGPGRRHAPPSRAAPPAARRPTRSAVKDLRDARRGIILMTILGPCRGRDSPAPDRPGSVP
jgi:hypothetical protein